MADCAAILVEAAKAAGCAATAMEGPHRRSLCRARAAHASPTRSRRSPASICWRRSTAAKPTATSSRRRRSAAGIQIADDDTWSDVFSRVLVERIEPQLGHRPRRRCSTEYPLPEAALARPRRRSARWRERFELYACGVELANGFGELTDAAEQRRRFEDAMAENGSARYGERYPIDEDFLAALAAHAAGERHRARLRPAGDAGDRRHADRAGAVGAGRRRRPLSCVALTLAIGAH